MTFPHLCSLTCKRVMMPPRAHSTAPGTTAAERVQPLPEQKACSWPSEPRSGRHSTYEASLAPVQGAGHTRRGALMRALS